MPKRRALGPDGRFGWFDIVPEEVWLEALVNAVIHRAYSNFGDHVRLEVFDDRLEVSSPGRFPGIASVDDLGDVRRFARNPRIARVMADLSYGQELGEGLAPHGGRDGIRRPATAYSAAIVGRSNGHAAGRDNRARRIDGFVAPGPRRFASAFAGRAAQHRRIDAHGQLLPSGSHCALCGNWNPWEWRDGSATALPTRGLTGRPNPVDQRAALTTVKFSFRAIYSSHYGAGAASTATLGKGQP